MYWINPLKLSENFNNLYDDETLLKNDKPDYLVSTFYNVYSLFTFFLKNLEFSTPKLNTFFDFKKINFQLLNINWYNFDIPFCLNPYIVINTNFLNLSTNLEINQLYHNYYLSYSHFDTL